jgi:hypothetical protein
MLKAIIQLIFRVLAFRSSQAYHLSGAFTANALLSTLMWVPAHEAMAQNYVPNGNFSSLTNGPPPNNNNPPTGWTATNVLTTQPTEPPNFYLGSDPNFPVGGSGTWSARLLTREGELGPSSMFAGTVVSQSFDLPAPAPGFVYEASFSLLTHTGLNYPNENLTGSLIAEVVNPAATQSNIIQSFTFNGGTDVWNTYSAVLTAFLSGGTAEFEFLVPTTNPLDQGHLLFADVSVAAVAAPGPIPGTGLLSYLALGFLGLGSLGWKRLQAA